MGRKKKERLIDRLAQQYEEEKKEYLRNRKIGQPCVYPVTGRDLDDFRSGKCKYSIGTEPYNTIKAVYDKSVEDEPAHRARWEATLKWAEESIRLTRENTVLALLFANGKGWPMPVCWWVIYTSECHYLTPDSSPGISIEKAIKLFFEEFRVELEITKTEGTPESLKQAIKRLKPEDWQGYYDKIKSLHKLSPSPYTRNLMYDASVFYAYFKP